MSGHVTLSTTSTRAHLYVTEQVRRQCAPGRRASPFASLTARRGASCPFGTDRPCGRFRVLQRRFRSSPSGRHPPTLRGPFPGPCHSARPEPDGSAACAQPPGCLPFRPARDRLPAFAGAQACSGQAVGQASPAGHPARILGPSDAGRFPASTRRQKGGLAWLRTTFPSASCRALAGAPPWRRPPTARARES